jgi:transposase-like protein
MSPEPATHPGYRFPADIISHAVWLYHVFGLSVRDVELILAERGIDVTHESVRWWCLRFGADLASKLRRRRPRPGDTRHLDEVYLRINGALHYLWRAVDQHGVVLDILVQGRRPERHGRQAVLQAPARRAALQGEAPRHRRAEGLRRRSARSCPMCGTGPADT